MQAGEIRSDSHRDPKSEIKDPHFLRMAKY